jgi:hypothetical protein
MEYYPVIKKNEVMLFAGKCIELEIIMLNKVSRIRKSKVTCLPLYVEARPERKMYTYTHFMYTFYIHDHVYK